MQRVAHCASASIGDQIERYGGSAGVRDLGLLDSAVAAPESEIGGGYLHGSLPEIAAA